MAESNVGRPEIILNPGSQQEQLQEPRLPDDDEIYDENYLKIEYNGPSLSEIKIGTLVKFGIKVHDGPPSPTVCIDLQNVKTGDVRNLNYIIKNHYYNVMFVLYEAGSYNIPIIVDGTTQLVIRATAVENAKFQESLVRTIDEMMKGNASAANEKDLLKRSIRNLEAQIQDIRSKLKSDNGAQTDE